MEPETVSWQLQVPARNEYRPRRTCSRFWRFFMHQIILKWGAAVNIFLLVGLLIGFGGMIAGYLLEGGHMLALWQVTAFLIVVGGTIGATLISTPIAIIKTIPGAMKKLIFPPKINQMAIIDTIVDFATMARKDGILALEEGANDVKDPFIKRGLLYIVDGLSPDALERCMQNEIDAAVTEAEFSAKFFENMGGFAPTMGVMGTVMGMVSILAELGGDAGELGEKISVAFIATLYGVGTANLIYLPIGSHIKLAAEKEALFKEVIVEGLMGIQEGDHPGRLKEKLMAKAGLLDKPVKTAKAGAAATGELATNE